jgi:hypothetical protein
VGNVHKNECGKFLFDINCFARRLFLAKDSSARNVPTKNVPTMNIPTKNYPKLKIILGGE